MQLSPVCVQILLKDVNLKGISSPCFSDAGHLKPFKVGISRAHSCMHAGMNDLSTQSWQSAATDVPNLQHNPCLKQLPGQLLTTHQPIKR